MGAIELAWNTRLVLVLETDGGMDRAIVLFCMVEVAVLEATTAWEEMVGAWLVQPPVFVLYPPLVEVALSPSALIRR